jgi:hypothetical protein
MHGCKVASNAHGIQTNARLQTTEEASERDATAPDLLSMTAIVVSGVDIDALVIVCV